MESTTNRNNTSKESYMSSDQNTTDCSTATNAEFGLVETDKMVEESMGRASTGYEGSPNLDPYLGMEFESEEAAKIFYNAYARRLGFSMRVSRNHRSRRDGTNIGRHFVCSKEGFREKKYQSNRPHTREGCKAMVKVKKGDSGKWVITKFVKEHNHALVNPMQVPLLRSHRRIPNPSTFDGARIGHSHILSVLKSESSESGNIDFTLRDCMDDTQSIRKRVFGRDAQYVLEYFRRMQAKNPSFFYAIQVDEEYHMTNFFWADARSRMAYNYFGDVVTFDTTYRTNRYGIPFTSFLGVNHHKQPVLFGCAVLVDETETSFAWLFNTWLEAMSGLHPVSLITDQDPVIGAAIAKVFPGTRHRFCKWHILRKFNEKLGHVERRRTNFREDFFKCINLTEMNDDFESYWWSLVDKYELRENEWLQSLYRTREQWVQVYLQDSFLGNISTSQQSEALNSFFEGHVNPHAPLQSFVNQCEKALISQYEKELDDDFKTSCMKPIMKTGLPMESQAAEIYTRTLFLEFQEQLFQSLRHIAEIIKEYGQISTFRVVEFGEEKTAYTVTFNVSEVRANCNCQMFEYSGILCRHALKVLNMKNVMLLPPHYVLKRWTRNATSGIILHDHGLELQGDCQQSRTLRHNNLCQQAIKYAAEGATTVDVYNVAVHALRKALEEVVAAKTNVGVVVKPSKTMKR